MQGLRLAFHDDTNAGGDLASAGARLLGKLLSQCTLLSA